MKTALRDILDKNAVHFSKDDEPHTPIIGVTQISLAQASVEYLITCGAKPADAINATCEMTMRGMQRWIAAYTKKSKGNGQ